MTVTPQLHCVSATPFPPPKQTIATKEQKSAREKRSVMKDWLKAVFRGQVCLCAATPRVRMHPCVTASACWQW